RYVNAIYRRIGQSLRKISDIYPRSAANVQNRFRMRVRNECAKGMTHFRKDVVLLAFVWVLFRKQIEVAAYLLIIFAGIIFFHFLQVVGCRVQAPYGWAYRNEAALYTAYPKPLHNIQRFLRFFPLSVLFPQG